jgi:hypothetical protein
MSVTISRFMTEEHRHAEAVEVRQQVRRLIRDAWAAMDSMKGAERTAEQQTLWLTLCELDELGQFRA